MIKLADGRKKDLNYEEWSREKRREERKSWIIKNDQAKRRKKEELVKWNEDIIIRVIILMLEVSKVIWK